MAELARLWTFQELALSPGGPDEWVKFNMESQNWALSQFMHGEQGALVCTAKIVETVPWMDANITHQPK
ncbi:MAG: hypothetical protein Ct9H300mP26_3730 [Acidimicrobiales bacterium]|nr:MAG: hypothetical protein Ct9H300mP26_3730 [Acidimicrobiales bacterium]